MKRSDERTAGFLVRVVDRFLFHKKEAVENKNQFAREVAAKMCSIELSEMWMLTQQ